MASTDDAAPSRPSGPAWWAFALAVFGGALGAVQSRINAQLAHELGDPFTAALVSFGVGLVVVGSIVLITPHLRRRTAGLLRDLNTGRFPCLYALGALGGAAVVLGQTFIVPITGVALFLVGVITGQTLTGLVLDRGGFGPGGPRPVSLNRVAGAGLMLVASAITAGRQRWRA